MPNVIHLAGRRHAETIGVLRHLLGRAQRGELGGLTFVIEDLLEGKDVAGHTGSHRREPGRIAAFMSRLCVRLSHLADQLENTGTR